MRNRCVWRGYGRVMGGRDGRVATGSAAAGPDVILFDLGGVLMNFGGIQRLAELSGCEASPAMRSRWINSPWVQAFERGECDADTFASHVVDDWNLDLSPSEFVDDFRNWSAGPFPGALDLVRRLRGTVRMGCLSNTNPVHWQQHLDRWGIVQHFDWTFTSHRMGVMKPNPAVFLHVIRALDIPADRLLFLDDARENVEAARRAGMHAEQTRGLEEVKDALRSHLHADSDAGRVLRP